ncbi:MAG: Eco57I restriction-modification methylase domain-containing protein, partial [Mycobacteriales bacterium]
ADRLIEAQRAHAPDSLPLTADDEQLTVDARRRVLDHCIYGVDVNPMAVEMAKLSLWLVTLDRSRPFGFLDDRLAVGDSLLGITSSEQLLALHMDPVAGRRLHDQALPLWTADTPALLKQAAGLRSQIADVELIDSRAAEYKAQLLGQARELTARLTVFADALSGASLAGGGNTRYLAVASLIDHATTGTDAQRRYDAYRDLVEKTRFALTDKHGQVRPPAHFPLLFPEVFTQPRRGFDAVVGNPPFLGGQKLTGVYGIPYRERLVRDIGQGARGSADLIAYMFLTAAALGDRDHGTFGLLATNTVAQGDTRQVGLDQITADGHHIYAAVKSEKWPTQAANLNYSIVWASRQRRAPGVRATADGVPVPAITPSLDPAGRVTGNPHRLAANTGLAFQGSNVLGMGFTMTEAEAKGLIDLDPRNADVLFPFVNGQDLNSRPDSSGSRWIINFFDWPEDRARQYTDCYAVVRHKVKPERDKVNREARRKYWWRYAEPAPRLYAAIGGLSHVLAITLVSKVVLPLRVPNGQIFSHATAVFATEDLADLALLSSALHYWWAITRSSTLETRIRYTPSDVFETLPRPEPTGRMRAAGQALDADRRTFMLGRQLGLTSTYNLVHDPAVADVEVAHLRALHVEVDEAVCAAYCWEDLPLEHGHHDTRQGVRWTVSPAVRVELLDRLLELNQARYAEEQGTGRRGGAGGRRIGSVGLAGQDEKAMLFHDDEDR